MIGTVQQNSVVYKIQSCVISTTGVAYRTEPKKKVTGIQSMTGIPDQKPKGLTAVALDHDRFNTSLMDWQICVQGQSHLQANSGHRPQYFISLPPPINVMNCTN